MTTELHRNGSADAASADALVAPPAPPRRAARPGGAADWVASVPGADALALGLLGRGDTALAIDGAFGGGHDALAGLLPFARPLGAKRKAAGDEDEADEEDEDDDDVDDEEDEDDEDEDEDDLDEDEDDEDDLDDDEDDDDDDEDEDEEDDEFLEDDEEDDDDDLDDDEEGFAGDEDE